MSAEPDNKETWEDLYRYLPYLRQALSCCVCRNILLKPMGPTHNVCHHFVCYKCIGGKMKLKPQCSWCKDHDGFKENSQLRLVVNCFHKLCEYISNSFIGREISSLSTPNGEKNNLLTILQEALTFEDDFKFSPSFNLPVLGLPPKEKTQVTETDPVSNTRQNLECFPVASTSRTNNLSFHKTSNKWKTRRKRFPMCKIFKKNLLKNKTNKIEQNPSDKSTLKCDEVKNSTKTTPVENQNFDSSMKKKRDEGNDTENKQKSLQENFNEKGDNSNIYPPLKKPKLVPASQSEIKICKCGRGGQNSRLTCLGQRCPCYIKRLPCIGCKCKGCRNPRKAVHLDPPLLIQESFKSLDSDEKKIVSVIS